MATQKERDSVLAEIQKLKTQLVTGSPVSAVDLDGIANAVHGTTKPEKDQVFAEIQRLKDRIASIKSPVTALDLDDVKKLVEQIRVLK